MNPELQTLVDRIELLERQVRGARWAATLSLLALAVALGAFVWPALRPRPTLVPPSTGRFAVVEANRIILRAPDARVAGGMEVDKNGTIRLVLGRAGETGAALLEAQANGVAHLSLKAPDGAVMATLVGSKRPGLALGNQPGGPSATIAAREDGAGEILVRDARGRTRFRAP